ncbi:hypothetical protein F5148DRAFT_1289432 [Russula earlei]|uniref:Uncharacterized protein n=1 Tax=Russula earlei TaxID=71964 RepID=A0ACC0TXN4_9AGAM|nr:hypothetical protein F5148DRAFT_1289432 [Russula earlei]
MAAAVLSSCAKTTGYDITGETDVKFFMNNASSGNAPQNAIVYTAVNIPNGTGSGLLNLSSTLPAAVQFPILASKPVGQDVTISAALDTTMVATYNAAHNTNYKVFPAGILSTDALVAHIAKGNTISTDSVTIAVNTANLLLLTDTTYMAPIKLTTIKDASAGNITGNATTQVTYVVVKVEQRRIKYLATTADVIGTLLTPRTAWAATFTPAVTTTGSIFDGSLTTYSRWAASPGQLDVDMQAAKNVTGIRLYTATSATYVPAAVDVYLSNDGITYDHIGAPLKANITYSTYDYILFYKPITARYIRLILSYSTSTNTQNLRVTEFDVYAN